MKSNITGRRLKFLQIDTFYENYLKDFYTQNHILRQASFFEQMKALQLDGFAAVHTLAPYMGEIGYEHLWIVGNSYFPQIKWAQENNIDIRNFSNLTLDIARYQIEAFQPDIIFTTNAMVFNSKFMRSLFIRPKLIMGFQASDIPPNTDWSEFDVILSPLKLFREEALKYGAKNAEHFMPGFPTWIYSSIKKIQPIVDLVFCGQWTLDQHKTRNELLEHIAKNSSTPGNEFAVKYFLSGAVDKLPNKVKSVTFGSKYGIEMHKALREGTIAFDAKGSVRSYYDQEKGLANVPKYLGENETATMRIFEATGSGVFLLTQFSPNLKKYFKLGEEIETYENEKELIDKIRFYISHPLERQEIAENGKKRCHDNYSENKKVLEIDSIIKKHINNNIIDKSNEKNILSSSGKNKSASYPRPNEDIESAIEISFQSYSQKEPVSRSFGLDRGTPIDRYYIEKFLNENSNLIQGSVLEIAENEYTKKFGSYAEKSDILSYENSSGATIVGDLSTGVNIPQNKFDCFILTQTIQMIYNVKSALKHAYAALKPGGCLLITASGISQISRYDMDRWGEYWRFTTKSLQQLLEEIDVKSEIAVESFGNVATAKAFLDGISAEELDKNIIDYNDKDYQLLICAKVVKPVEKLYLNNFSNSNLKRDVCSPAVFLYHRVAELDYDYNLLAVSPQNFEEHLKIIKNNFTPVSTAEIIKRIKTNSLTGDEVAITFDDGYYDNYKNALPILEKYSVPATIFVTSGFIDGNKNSWWDELEYIFLGGHLLPFSIILGDRKFSIETKDDKIELLNIFLDLLKDKSQSEIYNIISYLFNQLDIKKLYRARDRFLTRDELISLARSPLITIGSHTEIHSKLSILDEERLYAEIVTSKIFLESIINKKISSFSYPFGTKSDYNEASINFVKNAGYDFAFSNYPGKLSSETRIFEVPRFLVRNWNSNTFSSWVTSPNKSDFEKTELNKRNLYFDEKRLAEI